MDQELGVAADLIHRLNEAIVSGGPRKSFALMTDEDFGGVAKLAFFLAQAIFLEVAELG